MANTDNHINPFANIMQEPFFYGLLYNMYGFNSHQDVSVPVQRPALPPPPKQEQKSKRKQKRRQRSVAPAYTRIASFQCRRFLLRVFNPLLEEDKQPNEYSLNFEQRRVLRLMPILYKFGQYYPCSCEIGYSIRNAQGVSKFIRDPTDQEIVLLASKGMRLFTSTRRWYLDEVKITFQRQDRTLAIIILKSTKPSDRCFDLAFNTEHNQVVVLPKLTPSRRNPRKNTYKHPILQRQYVCEHYHSQRYSCGLINADNKQRVTLYKND